MVLSILASFFIAVLMGMGVGGGGLFVIFLTLCMNYGQILAQGTNLCFFILSALSSLFIHFKRRKINLKQVLTMIAFGSVGAILFSSLANKIDPQIPQRVLGGILIFSGFLTLYKCIKK